MRRWGRQEKTRHRRVGILAGSLDLIDGTLLMTDRLYYPDSFLYEFDATVADVVTRDGRPAAGRDPRALGTLSRAMGGRRSCWIGRRSIRLVGASRMTLGYWRRAVARLCLSLMS